MNTSDKSQESRVQSLTVTLRNQKGYRNLIAWQKANILAHLVYDITISFPADEKFGMTSQMRRAALSVCANIAEGYSRTSRKDRRHFYEMGGASLTELEFFLDFAFDRKYFNSREYEKVMTIHSEVARILSGLIKST